MHKNPLHRLLTFFVDVRPEETTSSSLMFLYFFLITSAAYIIKPVKISSFLDNLSINYIPVAYLITAVLIGFFVSLNTRLLGSMKRNVYISLSLIFFISCLFIFWILFSGEKGLKSISMIYWFWAELFTLTSVTQFWILINDIYNPRQVRRLVGFLVSGGLLGGVAGSLISSRLVAAKVVSTENLLLIPPLMLGACLVIVNLVVKLSKKVREEGEPLVKRKKPKVGYAESFKVVRENRHLLLLSGIMAATIIVATLIDFQFNSIVKHHFNNVENAKDAMTSFLGTFFAGLLIFSYLLHVSATSRILRNFGIRIALLITPLVLMLGSAVFFFAPGLVMAVFIKGSDKSLAHSLSQSVRELLYIPVVTEIKYKAKLFIDMFVNKFAKGLGAILILLLFLFFQPGFSHEGGIGSLIKGVSVIIIVTTCVWIILNILITREYVNIVKRNLNIKWQEADKLVDERIDVDMTKLVFDTIESKNRSSILYAMNLFDLVKREKMSSELKKIIGYKSGEIMASSMDSLLDLDGEALVPEMEDSLDEESLGIQVREVMSLDVYQELMKDHLDKIVHEGGREAEVSRMEAAKVMGMMESTPALIQNLSMLMRDESPEVVSYALESAGKLKRRELVPFIISQLSNPYLEGVAHKVLVNYGNKILGTLKDYMGDSEEDIKLRKAIPGILARSGLQRAADLLAAELQKEQKDIEPEIIAALYKMRSKNLLLQFPERIILPAIIEKIKECHLIISEIHTLLSDKKKKFMAKNLENNLSRTLKYIFDLLSLVYPRDDIIKAYQNICAGTKKSIDYSIELLDNLVKKDIMEGLIPLIEDIPLEDKVRKSKKLLRSLEKVKLS